jgi:hypothetical protein
MIDNRGAAGNWDTLLEHLAAELTCAAYRVALRQGIRHSWLKVELGLWRALEETVEKWARDWPPAGSSDEFEVWREGFLVNLTESAFHIAVKNGIKGSHLEVELCLYRAFRLVFRRVARSALRRQLSRGTPVWHTAPPSPSASVPRWSSGSVLD